MLCEYGCGQEAKYILKNGKNCCSKFSSSCTELRKKNSDGLKKSYESHNLTRGFLVPELRKEYYRKSRDSYKRNVRNKPFVELSRYLKKERILIEQGNCCLFCSLNEWLGKPLVMELDHINGNKKNEERENLRVLCPNCHSQTPTWRKKKKA